MRTRYLLWDHDGVIVDTERWYFEATRTALSRCGLDLSREDYLSHMTAGTSCWDLARIRGVTESEIRSLRAERDALYQGFLKTESIEIDGVQEVLHELSKRYRMAMVTTARRQDVELIHERRNLLHHFEFVLTIEDYEHPKPHADPYLAGLARLGARPEEAVVLEDSARGLASAKAAGIRCLVIRNTFTASQDFRAAWRITETVRDVPQVLAE